jgi:hypothetical protein
LFPPVEGIVTVWAPVFGFGFAKPFVDLEERMTDFAPDLLPAFSVIEIEKGRRSLTFWTGSGFGHIFISAATLDGFQLVSVDFLKIFEKLFPGKRRFGWFGFLPFLTRCKWVYKEFPVVRMFFLKSSFGFTSGLRFARIS